MHSDQFGRTPHAAPTLSARLADVNTMDTVGSVLSDCHMATANLEGLLTRIDAKLFGERPEVAQDICKTATEPPIESRCLGLRTRLREIVRYAETISDKL